MISAEEAYAKTVQCLLVSVDNRVCTEMAQGKTKAVVHLSSDGRVRADVLSELKMLGYGIKEHSNGGEWRELSW